MAWLCGLRWDIRILIQVYVASLPQIYKKSSVDYFVTQKMTWNDTNQLPFKLFWWESPDGSKVLAYFPHDYANNNLNPVRLSADLAILRKRALSMTEMMVFYGIWRSRRGTDARNSGPGISLGGISCGLQTMPILASRGLGSARPYTYAAIGKEVAPDSPALNYQVDYEEDTSMSIPVDGKIAIPTWKSELYFEYHRGVMTTQANHKRNMRESSEQVLNAEKWALARVASR